MSEANRTISIFALVGSMIGFAFTLLNWRQNVFTAAGPGQATTVTYHSHYYQEWVKGFYPRSCTPEEKIEYISCDLLHKYDNPKIYPAGQCCGSLIYNYAFKNWTEASVEIIDYASGIHAGTVSSGNECNFYDKSQDCFEQLDATEKCTLVAVATEKVGACIKAYEERIRAHPPLVYCQDLDQDLGQNLNEGKVCTLGCTVIASQEIQQIIILIFCAALCGCSTVYLVSSLCTKPTGMTSFSSPVSQHTTFTNEPPHPDSFPATLGGSHTSINVPTTPLLYRQ